MLYITSAFSIRSTGVERSSDANCSVLIVEGFPFRITVTPPAPASVSPPVLFADARQLGEGFVGIVHRLAFRYGFQVIGQPPLFDPHDGFFALYDHGVERIVYSCRTTSPASSCSDVSVCIS